MDRLLKVAGIDIWYGLKHVIGSCFMDGCICGCTDGCPLAMTSVASPHLIDLLVWTN